MAILFSGDFHASARGELDLIYKDTLVRKYGQERYNLHKVSHHFGGRGLHVAAQQRKGHTQL